MRKIFTIVVASLFVFGLRSECRAEEWSPTGVQVQTVRFKDVVDGFTFKDVLGRKYRLIGVQPVRYDSPALQLEYDSNIRTVFRSWLTTPGETLYVMHDGRRGRDGVIPALIFVGENVNVALEYATQGFANVDENAPEWFDAEAFAQQVAELSNMDELLPADDSEAAGALTIVVSQGRRILYSGYVYPYGGAD